MNEPSTQADHAPQFPTSEKGTSRGRRSGWQAPPVGQYLFVPYEERNQASQLGAYWHAEQKAWYVPAGADPSPFSRWANPPPQRSDIEIQSDFAVFCEEMGLVLDGLPEMDGKWHGVPVTTSRSTTAKKGRYVLERDPDGAMRGHAINNDTGQSQKWYHKGEQVSEQERDQIRRMVEENRRQKEAELQKEQQTVAHACKARWDRLSPASDTHAYLVRKGVEAHGLRQEGNKLVTAIRDAQGTIWSLQLIGPQGDKLYVTGGVKAGNFHVFGDLDKGKTVLFGEGYATCASLHEATGLPVVEVFDASNIEPAMTTLKPRLAGKDKIICGDDDVLTHGRVVETLNQQATSDFAAPKLKLAGIEPGEVIVDGMRRTLKANPQCSLMLEYQTNPQGVQRVVGDIYNQETDQKVKVQIVNLGREKALAAAEKHEAKAVFPVFQSLEGRPTDFNDLQHREGRAAVRRQVGRAMMLDGPAHPPVQQSLADVARAALGASTIVKPAGENQQYVGAVVGATSAHAVQDVGRATAVAHQLDKLDKVPRVGERAKIVYQDGKGAVHPMMQSREGIVR